MVGFGYSYIYINIQLQHRRDYTLKCDGREIFREGEGEKTGKRVDEITHHCGLYVTHRGITLHIIVLVVCLLPKFCVN